MSTKFDDLFSKPHLQRQHVRSTRYRRSLLLLSLSLGLVAMAAFVVVFR